jgi:luciferase family oxidoreductase group 1
MLPLYSALKVAEQFRVLEAIAPGRIDLGVGRAPGSDGRTALALNPNAAAAADHFPAMLRDLQAWSGGYELPVNHPFRVVRAEPAGPYAPEIWVLGSSNYGAQVAAFFGLPYCYAYFFNDGQGAEQALDIYRATYRPSELNPKPHSAVTVWAFAGETQEEADFYYQSRAIARLMRDRGHYIPLPSPQTAASFELSDLERAQIARVKETALSGTAADVASRLRALAAELGIDELAITTTAYDPAARQNSYTLLAREFALGEAKIAA